MRRRAGRCRSQSSSAATVPCATRCNRASVSLASGHIDRSRLGWIATELVGVRLAGGAAPVVPCRAGHADERPGPACLDDIATAPPLQPGSIRRQRPRETRADPSLRRCGDELARSSAMHFPPGEGDHRPLLPAGEKVPEGRMRGGSVPDRGPPPHSLGPVAIADPSPKQDPLVRIHSCRFCPDLVIVVSRQVRRFARSRPGSTRTPDASVSRRGSDPPHPDRLRFDVPDGQPVAGPQCLAATSPIDRPAAPADIVRASRQNRRASPARRV